MGKRVPGSNHLLKTSYGGGETQMVQGEITNRRRLNNVARGGFVTLRVGL